jgi:hypothetical protein
MKKILAIFLLVWSGAAFAQDTKTQLNNLNDQLFTANGVGAITGPDVNNMFGTFIDSSATLLDTNIFTQLQVINPNATAANTPQTGALLQLLQVPGTTDRIELDAYAAANHISGVRWDGTQIAPTPVQSGETISSFNGWAYNGVGVVGPTGAYKIYAGENQSGGHAGSKLCMSTTPIGSTTLTDSLCQNPSGGITIGTPTGGDEGAGTLNLTTLYINGTAFSTPVASVSNSDGTLTISPTTGNVVASLNLGKANTWTATQTFPSASITNAELAHSTISGISLGSNLDTLTFGTHLAAGGSSYNGSAGVTISTDATNLDTASTIVARDASGNFVANAVTFTTVNGLTITTSSGTLTIANGETLTDTSGVGADLLLGSSGGGFTAYGGTSSAGSVLTALSAAGAGSFLTYGTTGNSTLVETTSGGLLTASILPAATTSTLGAVSTDGATIANSSGAISCRTATSTLLGCASFGTGLTVSAGAVTPTFGTATNQVAEGGVITAGGPTGSATAVPVITYNAAGQLTTVTTAALGTAAADNTGTSGGTIPLNNGGFTQSGAATFSSTLAESDAALPSVTAGQLGLAGGSASNPSLGANDEGDIYLVTANGLTEIGKGSTYDVSLLDSAGNVALGISTGTVNVVFGGQITAASLATPSSNIAGSICATSGGSLLYNSGANCYTGGGTAGGSNTQVQYNNSSNLGGISGVTSNGTAMTFANGDLILSGSSSGTTTLEASATASGTITFPAATDTVTLLGTAQTFTALKKFTNADFSILGSSTGYTLLESGLSSTSNNTLTLPTTSSDTIAAIGTAETWTAVQTFTNSDIRELGSSTGYTTITSNNSSATNYTWTIPADTDTFAGLNTTDQVLAGGATVTAYNPSAGSLTVDCGKSPLQWILNTGAFTITAPTSVSSNCALRVINGTTASNAGAVTLSNFSGKSPGGATFATTATISAATCSFTNSSANITWTQSLPLNSMVFFATTNTLPTGFSTSTIYYVTTTGASTIQVSATPGGSAITAGSAGSGTQTCYEPSVYDLVMLQIDGPIYGQWIQVQ